MSESAPKCVSWFPRYMVGACFLDNHKQGGFPQTRRPSESGPSISQSLRGRTQGLLALIPRRHSVAIAPTQRGSSGHQRETTSSQVVPVGNTPCVCGSIGKSADFLIVVAAACVKAKHGRSWETWRPRIRRAWQRKV